jgi:hypothetical protein
VYACRNLIGNPAMIIRKSDEGHDYLTMEVEFYRSTKEGQSDNYDLISAALRIYDAFNDLGITADSEACDKSKLDSTTS